MLLQNLKSISFTLPDILLLLGIAQCCYIIVYLAFRSGRISRGGLPLLYFVNLLAAFTLTFLSNQLPEYFLQFSTLIQMLWGLQTPLCILLIIQVAQIYKVPALRHYWVLALPPIAFGAATLVTSRYYQSCEPHMVCAEFQYWLSFCNQVAGSIALISLWFNRHIIDSLTSERNHQERYWLIIALIIINAAYIATMFFALGLEGFDSDMHSITILFGLAVAYLAGTSLFRIYPQAVRIAEFKKDVAKLSITERLIARKIEDLVYMQKVYQEPTYSRSDIAKECDAPEAMISRIINVHFGQSFPQLMNFYRVEDAKRLIKQTDEPMSIIAEQSGFNSLATFNRVFKDQTGQSPSQYRKG